MPEWNIGDITVRELPDRVEIRDVSDKPSSMECLVIRDHLEAEALARALERVFGAGQFKVIRQRSSDGHFRH